MRKLIMWLALAAVILVSSNAFASAETTVQSQSAFGTIARGTTVCVGNLVPTTADGVQIAGFTNGSTSLTWQVLTVSANSAPAVVFETTARFVDHTVPPVSGNFLYQACVVKNANSAQDFNLTLNSQPIE